MAWVLQKNKIGCVYETGLEVAEGLVRDGADGVVAPAVDDLVGMRSDDDLVDQQLRERTPVLCRLVLPRSAGVACSYQSPVKKFWTRGKRFDSCG